MRYSSRIEPSSSPSVLADRLHLLAQEVLALLLLRTGLDVLADPLAQLKLGEALTLEAQRQLQTLDDVERLQQLDLLVEVDVGRVARGICEHAGLGDRANERRHAAVVAAQLEDLLDGGAVLGLQLPCVLRGRWLIGSLDDLNAQAPLRIALRGAGLGAVQAVQHGRTTPTGQADGVGDLGDGAYLREVALVARNEQDALLALDVDRQRDVHRREDDGVVERDQQQGGHVLRDSSDSESCASNYSADDAGCPVSTLRGYESRGLMITPRVAR